MPKGGARLNPHTDGRPDLRPDVRENAPILGNLLNDFDFNQAPRPPMLLPLHPQTDLIEPSSSATTATRPAPRRKSASGLSQLELQILSAYLQVPAPRLAAQLASGQPLARVILEHGGTLAGFRRYLALFGPGAQHGVRPSRHRHRRRP